MLFVLCSQVARTNGRGWGLFVKAPLKKGAFIIEYVGELISMEEFHRRINDTMRKNEEMNYYYMTMDSNRMIDAAPKGMQIHFYLQIKESKIISVSSRQCFPFHEPFVRSELRDPEVDGERRHEGRPLHDGGHPGQHGANVQLPVGDGGRRQKALSVRSP